MITVKLINPAMPFFFLPGGKLHLTETEPGPITVDPEDLTHFEKIHILNAKKRGFISVEGEGLEEVQPTAKQEGLTQEEKETPIDVKRDENIKKVQNFLSGPAKTVRETIQKSQDLLFLRLAKEEEQKGKKRKTVLALLETRLNALQEQVSSSIQIDVGEIEMSYNNKEKGVNQELISEITEEAEREVVIRPLSEEDFEDQE